MIVVDASVLIAHLNPRDVHHEAATQLLLTAASEALLAHTITLAEVLVGGVRVGREAQLCTDLESIGIRAADHDDLEPLRLARLRASSGLKLPDCCVLDAALENSASLATFDVALAAAARERGVPVHP